MTPGWHLEEEAVEGEPRMLRYHDGKGTVYNYGITEHMFESLLTLVAARVGALLREGHNAK